MNRAPVVIPPAHLTPEQRRDFRTLVEDGRYPAAEALEMVTRPRRRIRATPPPRKPEQ